MTTLAGTEQEKVQLRNFAGSEDSCGGPLAGVRVLEISGIGPGPFCGMLLADLGADVVRVDRPGGGPWNLIAADRDPLGRNKRSVEVDLKQPEGVQTVLSLAAHADILFEGFRPGVAERLGIGPEECWRRRPQLVYGRMTGWGQDGPLRHTAGHDICYIAPTGALHAIGQAGAPPAIPLNLVGDYGGGSMYLAVGLLAALLEARTSGKGQVVDAAIVDGAAHLMTAFYGLLADGGWQDERGANLIDGGAPFYGVYETSDGKYLAVGALEPEFYAEFLKRLELDVPPSSQLDRTGWPRLRQRIAERIGSAPRHEWLERFGDGDGCVAPVLSLREAPDDPHLAARGTFLTRFGVRQPAPAPRFSRTPGTIRRDPEVLGGTAVDDVLTGWATLDRGGSDVPGGGPADLPARAGAARSRSDRTDLERTSS